MKNITLRKHKFGGNFLYPVEYTRIVKRKSVKNEIIYTVATSTNCIQGNFNSLEEAIILYNKIVQEQIANNYLID